MNQFVIILLDGLLFAGPVIERVFLKPVHGKDEVIGLLTTSALFLILEDLMKVIWDIDSKFIGGPFSMMGNLEIVGITYAVYPFLLTGIALATGLFFWILADRTKIVRQVTAVIKDREMPAAMGINVLRIDNLVFTPGTLLAAFAGAFVVPRIPVEPGLGIKIIVLAFAVIGGGPVAILAVAARGGRSTSFSTVLRRRVWIDETGDVLNQVGLRDVTGVGGKMSEGGFKILDVAMSLLLRPKVFLMDEPTAWVSVEDKFLVMDTLMPVLKDNGVTILFVE